MTLFSVQDIAALALGISLLPCFYWLRTPHTLLISGFALTSVAAIFLYLLATSIQISIIVFFAIAGYLCVIGLAFVRVILIRSVSLNALFAAARHATPQTSSFITATLEQQITEEIKTRIHDLDQRQLVSHQSGQLLLTAKGRAVAKLAQALTRLTAQAS